MTDQADRPAPARRAAVRRGAGELCASPTPTQAKPPRLEALAVGRRDLPARRHAAERLRDQRQVHRQRAPHRDRRRHARHRPRAAAATAFPARPRPGSASTWPPPSPATPRCWSRARPAPTRADALRLELCAAARRRPVAGGAGRQPDDARDARRASIARIEELTRIPADVQDTLITDPLREDAADARAGDGGAGAQGLQRHRHRQQPRQGRQRAFQRPDAPLQHRRAAGARHRRGGGRDRRSSACASSAARWSCPPRRRPSRRSAAS